MPAKLNQDDLDGHSSTSQYSPTNSHDSRCSVSVEENEFSSSSEEEFPRVESIPKQISSMSFHSTQGHGISDCSPYRMVYVVSSKCTPPSLSLSRNNHGIDAEFVSLNTVHSLVEN